MIETPVSHKLDRVKQVDDFIFLILGRINPSLTNDSSLEKFQKKILDLMGTLSVHWIGLEGIKRASEERVSVAVNDFSTLV